jgi:hypothetical protein
MSKEDYRKLETECLNCKTKFDIWLSMSNFDLGQAEIVKKNFYQHCPACKITEGQEKSG